MDTESFIAGSKEMEKKSGCKNQNNPIFIKNIIENFQFLFYILSTISIYFIYVYSVYLVFLKKIINLLHFC